LITNVGKAILGKFLINQAPAYASYLAFGCGPKPLTSSTQLDLDEYATKTELEFEMFRVPISTRGFVNDDGVSNVVLSAELPTDERYEITEVGIFSSASNPSSIGKNSRTVIAFSDQENWEYHSQTAATRIVQPPAITDETGDIILSDANYPSFRMSADNPIFDNFVRRIRYERPRYFNNTVMISGASSTISSIFETTGDHIHLNNQTFNFDQNSSIDELRLAFSVINKNNDETNPDTVRIIIEFASNDATSNFEYARFEYSGSVDPSNRYSVVSQKLEDLSKTPSFSWAAVSVVKIYVSVIDDGVVSDEYYVALDALRIENMSDVNPLYGLTGYTTVVNNGLPLTKNVNSSNIVEFRFGLGIQ